MQEFQKLQSKCIVFDMDDTLLDKEGRISERTKRVLCALREQGHRIVMNTARSKQYSLEFFDELPLDYAILNGGALILDENQRPVYQKVIPAEEVRKIAKKVLAFTEVFSVQAEDGMYTNNKEYTGQNAVWFDFREKDWTEDVYKIIVGTEEDEKAEAVAKEFGLEYTSYFGGTFKRYNVKDTTKATGNRTLVKLLGMSLQDVIAFGDDIGDVDMLREAGVGVLMCNAREVLKNDFTGQEGCVISKYSHDEDGVARFLEEYFGLN